MDLCIGRFSTDRLSWKTARSCHQTGLVWASCLPRRSRTAIRLFRAAANLIAFQEKFSWTEAIMKNIFVHNAVDPVLVERLRSLSGVHLDIVETEEEEEVSFPEKQLRD